ncbi:MAG: hypothetical protein J0L87_01050 [Bacteroidetes bacterium]|nr:hypothetical protein [Bacteroidota bacterium]
MISRLSNKINSFLLSTEQRLGLLFTSLLLAFVIIGFDMLYITPRFESAFHGAQYALLSEAPFDFTQANALRYRILPSLLGYLTGLRGSLFFIVPLIFTLLLIAAVYFVYRKKNYSSIDSFLFTGLIAFSGTVYIQLQAAGYTDTAFYLFMFLSFAFVHRPFMSILFFLLGVFTHESCLFLLPALLLYFGYKNGNDKRILIKYVIGLLSALVIFLLYRMWISAHVKVEYDLNFYFSANNLKFTLKKVLPYFSVGGFYAFKLFWLLPVFAIYRFRKERLFVSILVTIIICVFAQLIIAFDITRVICLAFPAILIAAERLHQECHDKGYTNYLLGLILANFFLLQYFMSADALIPMPPLLYSFALNYFGIDF